MPEDGLPPAPGGDEFVDALPEMEAGDSFCFDCGPQVPCFNLCCADLILPITPYDALRLRRHLGISGAELLNVYTRQREYPDSGFPLPLARMVEGPEAKCPFVGPAGCSVYADRPGACRSYPLGRGAKLGVSGLSERFFVVREEHCRGFDEGSARTPAQWFENQGMAVYNHFNDRYMRLISMVRATGKPLEPKMAGMALLCLYQLDRFRDLIEKMGIFSRLRLAESQKALIMEDSLDGDEACLEFALDWLELVIFGQAENLRKKGA